LLDERGLHAAQVNAHQLSRRGCLHPRLPHA